jgi:hypothetical protein
VRFPASKGLVPVGVAYFARLNYCSVWSFLTFAASATEVLFMPKNIVVYSDGTGQDGGVRPEQRISNVYKMYRSSYVHPDNPIVPPNRFAFMIPV